MPQANVPLQPHPSQIEAFSKLVNARGLVAMRISRPFAPYSRGDIAGFNHELAARLFVRREGVPVNEKGEEIKIDSPAPEPKAIPVHLVEIPLNWGDLHILQRVQLAKQIAGNREQKLSREEADEIIVAELKRRETDAAEPNEA
jgi:hypothetical protein